MPSWRLISFRTALGALRGPRSQLGHRSHRRGRGIGTITHQARMHRPPGGAIVPHSDPTGARGKSEQGADTRQDSQSAETPLYHGPSKEVGGLMIGQDGIRIHGRCSPRDLLRVPRPSQQLQAQDTEGTICEW